MWAALAMKCKFLPAGSPICRTGRSPHGPHPPPNPGRSPNPLRFLQPARARTLPSTDRRQRHRSPTGDRPNGRVTHGRAGASDRLRQHQTSILHPRRRQKTAERIALELRTKLSEWRDQTGLSTVPTAGPVDTIREDVELTLLALGYSQREVRQALEAVGRQKALSKSGDGEAWIREAIAWLSLQN